MYQWPPDHRNKPIHRTHKYWNQIPGTKANKENKRTFLKHGAEVCSPWSVSGYTSLSHKIKMLAKKRNKLYLEKTNKQNHILSREIFKVIFLVTRYTQIWLRNYFYKMRLSKIEKNKKTNKINVSIFKLRD